MEYKKFLTDCYELAEKLEPDHFEGYSQRIRGIKEVLQVLFKGADQCEAHYWAHVQLMRLKYYQHFYKSRAAWEKLPLN